MCFQVRLCGIVLNGGSKAASAACFRSICSKTDRAIYQYFRWNTISGAERGSSVFADWVKVMMLCQLSIYKNTKEYKEEYIRVIHPNTHNKIEVLRENRDAALCRCRALVLTKVQVRSFYSESPKPNRKWFVSCVTP